MRLDELTLSAFRNYDRLDARWDAAGALLCGDNGAGKSNLLEAIHLLSLGRSHRTQSDREMVAMGAASCRVQALGASEREGRFDVAITMQPGGSKQVVVNGKEEGRLSSLVGRIGTVMVAPEDMEIARGAPERRRRFVDQLLSQARPAHLAALQSYARALRQRNLALREVRDRRAPEESAAAWDAPLLEWGARVREARAAMAERLARRASSLFREVSGQVGHLDVSYPAAQDDLAAQLARVRATEARRGMTLAGPHRDDIAILLDGKDVRAFGSRGQQRASTFALKIAAADLFEEERGEGPILLLDDVFAELDRARADRLGALLAGRGQVFATATSAADLVSRFRSVPVYQVAAGRIDAAPSLN
jgi:DNA replication and repair protein RecF